MAFIEGTDRFQSQLFDFFAFDNLISEDNYVRVIDAFVDSLNLSDLGFIIYPGERGQKPYHTDILLKIHIYCFFNGIQSSRKQERECTRNIELFDFKIFAFDGTKIKANCSKKRAFTIDKLTKALDNI